MSIDAGGSSDPASELRRELLQSIVAVARSIFLAQAASIAVLDTDRGELVFEAAAGAGESIVGGRFPAGQGLAGYVAQSGEPLIIDDLSSDPRFARDLAEQTGYMPHAMMVVPLLREERTLGVLEVLDRGHTGRSALQELQLLVHFADQAAIALELSRHERSASPAGPPGDLTDLAGRLDRLDGARRAAARRLLDALADLIGAAERP